MVQVHTAVVEDEGLSTGKHDGDVATLGSFGGQIKQRARAI